MSTRMQTQLWKVDPNNIDQEIIAQAAELIKRGEVVAFPTETVYGLGADGLNPDAVRAIFTAKGRPADNPLILHICRIADLSRIAAEIPDQARQLMERFWPGPLTVVLPRTELVPDVVTAGLDTVAIRMPSHPVAQALIAASGVPLAAPSANLSGKPSPTRAEHVWEDLQGRIAGLIDAGPVEIGLESTVLDLSGEVPYLLRPGGISREQLEAVLGEVRIAGEVEDQETPKAPGMKYRHYAPRAPLYVVSAETSAEIAALLQSLVNEAQRGGERVGLIVSEETRAFLTVEAAETRVIGSRENLAEVAHNLFGILRDLDQTAVTVIYAEGFPPTGVGAAVMNRLYKAAGGRLITP